MPPANRKKVEVVAMMKRAKGVTLAEITQAAGWRANTVRGFVSILGIPGLSGNCVPRCPWLRRVRPNPHDVPLPARSRFHPVEEERRKSQGPIDNLIDNRPAGFQPAHMH
jgi:hypothetical protein